eukprot:2290892-Prymnesium_polylepis.2
MTPQLSNDPEISHAQDRNTSNAPAHDSRGTATDRDLSAHSLLSPPCARKRGVCPAQTQHAHIYPVPTPCPRYPARRLWTTKHTRAEGEARRSCTNTSGRSDDVSAVREPPQRQTRRRSRPSPLCPALATRHIHIAQHAPPDS